MTDMYSQRRARLCSILEGADFDAAAFVPGSNFYYLSGVHFHLMERPTLMIITSTGDVLGIIPDLERSKWLETFPDAQTFFWRDQDGFDTAFENAAAALGELKIGIESQRMRAFEADALRIHLGQGGVVHADKALSELRLSKDDLEIEATLAAIRISEKALDETLGEIRTGMTERQILNMLKMRLMDNGADAMAFDPIVLAGGNSASPHGSPGDSRLSAGDALLFDFGAQLDGYNADITRTFFCEHVEDEHAEIYETVLAANARGRELAGPGLTAHDLDAAVTSVLAESNFADMIVHKTGHGLGLDVHEAPQVMVGNHAQLVDGVLLTIEPGLYRNNEIGVRIEDDVLIEADGCRSLTTFSREIMTVGG